MDHHTNVHPKPKHLLKPDEKMMTLDAVCDKTDYKESCMSSLQPVVSINAKLTTNFRAAVYATLSEQ
jgi:hypothetical protein